MKFLSSIELISGKLYASNIDRYICKKIFYNDFGLGHIFVGDYGIISKNIPFIFIERKSNLSIKVLYKKMLGYIDISKVYECIDGQQTNNLMEVNHFYEVK